jgi:hypothetical protein
MSIKNLVNSPDWEEAEQIIEDKMSELLRDFPKNADVPTMACHALANQKAYTMLEKWLKDMSFHRGSERQVLKRNMI